MTVLVNGVVETLVRSTTSGITASTTQTQGQGALTDELNEVSVCANANDVVTLPPAGTGLTCIIINNGAETLQIFPASGDNLGTGIDASMELEPNESIEYIAYDNANWHIEATTEIFHAEMFDTENTDVFVMAAANEDHLYHTNGAVAGDLLGFTFDAGGGGTSFPIASITDGTDSGVDIAVTTTGSHGLAVGDIISQNGLADAAYQGAFVVKAVISTTVYEVAAVFTATGTGTMNQAATLNANVGSAGEYLVTWSASATSAANNETFDFAIHIGAAHQSSTNTRRKFGTGGDFGSFGGTSVVTVADGDRISFMIINDDSTGNITIRNFTLVLTRL